MAAPAYKSHSTAVANSGNASFSIAAPSGVAAGDYQIVSIIYASSSGNVGTTPSGWTLLDNTAMTLPSGDTGRVAIYESTTSTTAFTMTFTSARVWAAVRAAYTLPAGSSGRVKALGKNIETPTGTTTHATPAMTTTVADSLIIVTGGVDSTSASQNWTGFGNFTSRAVVNNTNTSEREVICLADRTIASPTSNVTANFTTALADEAGMYAIVLEGVAGASAPTVNAGSDVTDHTVNTLFSRTATEENNGATITAREWEITSGPTGVGTVIGTAAALSWTPTVTGSYVLEYSATNSAGTGTDSVNVTVVAAPPSDTPGELLNIGHANGKVHFGWDIAEAGASERVLYPPSDIANGLNLSPEFTTDGTWVRCQAQADAPTTSGTGFPRSEGREYEPGGDTTLGFNPKDGNTHWIRFRARIVQHPLANNVGVCTGQLHSAQDDIVMVRSRVVSGTNTLVLRVYDPEIDNTVDVLTLDSSYTFNDEYDIMFLIHGDYVYVFYNDFTQYAYRFETSLLPTLSTYFFKMGAYIQFNETTSGISATDVGRADVKNANHWHTGWTAPENYFGCPEVDTGAAATATTGVAFTRTATESGSGITERKWAILEGPAGEGTSIGTAAALNWTPTVAGNYVLIYGAKNAEGWSNPEFLNVTVSSGGGGGGVRSRTTGKGAASATHNVSLPAGATSGDRVVVGFVNDHAHATAAPSTGWTSLGTEDQGTTTNHRMSLFTRVLDGGANDSLTVTITDSVDGNARDAAWTVICMNGDGGAPIAPATIRFDDGGAATTGPLIGYTGLTSGDYDSLIFLGLDNSLGLTQTITAPSGYAQEQLAGVSGDSIYAWSAEDQLTGVTSVTPANITWSGSEQWITAHVLMPALTAVAPTVGAGANATIDQYDNFNRTATEDDGGATITSRAWTVQSGPNQVGATIGTSATLNWAPTVGGVYVLRYTATNSQGSGFDEVQVTVNALNFPVTASLALTGSQVGQKQIASSRSGNLVLSGTRAGQKRMSFAPTANLVLDGSATGNKLNVGSGTIRLHAAAINVGRPGEANVSATIKLLGSAGNASRVTTGVTASGLLRLQGTQTGQKQISVVRTANLVLDGDIANILKHVAVSPSGNLVLDGVVTNVFHASFSTRVAELILAAEAINPEHHVTTPVVVPAGNLNLNFSSVTSSVRFNQTVPTGNLILHGQAFGQRIITEVSAAILPRADNTTKYELVVVARIPQISGPPAFFEVDPLDWTSITYSEELSGIPTLSASVKIGSLTPDVKLRLQTLHDLPTELWLYRNGKHVFAGPLLGFNASNEDAISLEALGLMAYTQMWFVTKDLVYKDVDQFAIVKGLIDQWQELEYGNYGIVTPSLTSGVLRTITYNYKEIHNVYDRISELTKMTNGFDISIDPAGRNLELYYPYRGIDRSVGEDRIVFDQRNVTSSNIVCSIGPRDLASEGLGTGTGPAQDQTFVGTASNPELRAKYGRTGITSTFGQVSDQATLNSYVQAMVDARGAALLIPGPNARVSVDSDIASYDIGDTVDYQLHTTLSVSGAYRIRKRTVSVRETGTESVSIEFV